MDHCVDGQAAQSESEYAAIASVEDEEKYNPAPGEFFIYLIVL